MLRLALWPTVTLALLLVGCSGYHFKRGKRPFSMSGIQTLAIPMFVNHSIIPNIAGPMTKEFSLLLSQYSGLTILPGASQEAEAVLLGIISSAQHQRQLFLPESYQFTDGALDDSTAQRRKFYVPLQTRYQIAVRIILIKRPSKAELRFLSAPLSHSAKFKLPSRDTSPTQHLSKVVFDEQFNITGRFSHFLDSNTGPQSGGAVNFTRTRGNLNKSLGTVAQQAAQTFKKLVLDAF